MSAQLVLSFPCLRSCRLTGLLFLLSPVLPPPLMSHMVWDAVSASLGLPFSSLLSCLPAGFPDAVSASLVLSSCLSACVPCGLGCCVRALGLSPEFHVRFVELFGVYGGEVLFVCLVCLVLFCFVWFCFVGFSLFCLFCFVCLVLCFLFFLFCFVCFGPRRAVNVLTPPFFFGLTPPFFFARSTCYCHVTFFIIFRCFCAACIRVVYVGIANVLRLSRESMWVWAWRLQGGGRVGG